MTSQEEAAQVEILERLIEGMRPVPPPPRRRDVFERERGESVRLYSPFSVVRVPMPFCCLILPDGGPFDEQLPATKHPAESAGE